VEIFVIINIIAGMSSTSMNKEASTASYVTLAAIQFLLIAFIAPSLTSGAISGERERQTLDLLLCTKLRSRTIILGKLFSSISQVVLLIVASFPVFATVFVFGGISIVNLLQLFLFYLVAALLMGSIGIFFSVHLRKTITSNVVTYGFVLFLLFGTLFLAALYMQLANKPIQPQPGVPYTPPKQTFFPLLYTNPLVGFASLLMDQFGTANGIGIPLIGSVFPRGTANSIEPWKINTIFNFVFSCVLLGITSLKINPLKKKYFRKMKKVKSHGLSKSE
jgi:ABC-type transport system involved in multi-copper enzyme maturation permease subunit